MMGDKGQTQGTLIFLKEHGRSSTEGKISLKSVAGFVMHGKLRKNEGT